MDELIARLEAAEEGACWIWPRKIDTRGRGRIWVNGKLLLAHRAVWEHLRGPIPSGMMLCHHCDNPSCVNPAHLYVGTHKENMRDMVTRRRYFFAQDPERCREAGRSGGLKNNWARGPANPKAKLSVEQAQSIYSDDRPTKVLAAIYGVNYSTIQRIRRGQFWPGPSIAALRARQANHD